MAVEKHEMPDRSPQEWLRKYRAAIYEQDREDIEYWRNASEEEHGKDLRELMRFADLVIKSTGYIDTNDAPRFPKPRHESTGK